MDILCRLTSLCVLSHQHGRTVGYLQQQVLSHLQCLKMYTNLNLQLQVVVVVEVLVEQG
jgi:hypothetical protein